MAEGADQASKTEPPSQKRLDDARRKGDIPKSPEVGSFVTLAAAAAVLLMQGPALCHGLAQALTPFLAHPDAIPLQADAGVGVMRSAMAAAWPVSAVMLAAMVAGVVASLAQQGLMFLPHKLAPNFSKLDVFAGVVRLMGLDNFVSFLKSVVKMMLIGLAAWWVVAPRLSAVFGLAALAPSAVIPLSAEMLRGLIVAVLAASGAIAAFDWFWTRMRFNNKMKMSREDMKQEHKDADGDPHIKARLRQIRAERAKRRLSKTVPTATVVVTNPTHFAVALRYVAGETAAPQCVAKGVDAMALRIRAIAQEHGVTIVEDPPLARALYAAVEVDAVIPREHFEAVAKVIGFIMSKGRRANAGQGAPT